jgi:tetratricopeptide (TPR) repeat protein
MSELRIEELVMPAAPIGPESPHPQFDGPPIPNAPSRDKVHPDVPASESGRIGYGGRSSALPYKLQDDLTRMRTPRSFKTAVLENDTLRATFLLEAGGRLWSLVHKPSGRELLHRNPVFQPGFLGIRVAWFSGGVEWNFCWPGHTPLTCEPLFAARASLADGTPVLRLYEYERVRGLAYQLDCFLPDGSDVLLVRVAIHNPDDRTVPVYWWSNIAVPEVAGMRVLAPAESKLHFAYDTGWLDLQQHPLRQGVDTSVPQNIPIGNDDYYYIPDHRQPWIAALGPDGSGLFHASSTGLRGRKMFVWGQLSSSHFWQEFLNTPGHPYIEIQAGLERTQASCRPLPGRECFEWVEAYGLIETDARISHGRCWSSAWKHADSLIARQAAEDRLEAVLAETRQMSLAAPERLLHRGSGWGSLELRRRARSGERPFCGPALPFPDDTLGPQQAPWLALLERGVLPAPPVADDPASYQVQEQWQNLLETSVAAKSGDNWFAQLELGIMHFAAGRHEPARAAWEASLRHAGNPWAHRNLAQFAVQAKDWATAQVHYRTALAARPDDWRMVLELGRVLLAAGDPAACLALIQGAPAAVRSRRRVQFTLAEAAIALDQLDIAGPILRDENQLADAQEGDAWVSGLWFNYKAKAIARESGIEVTRELQDHVRKTFPPPRHLDYRMA